MRRHAIQVAELVEPHTQGDTNFAVESTGARMPADKVIKLSLIPKAAKDNLGGQASVARIQAGCELPEQVGSPTTGFHSG